MELTVSTLGRLKIQLAFKNGLWGCLDHPEGLQSFLPPIQESIKNIVFRWEIVCVLEQGRESGCSGPCVLQFHQCLWKQSGMAVVGTWALAWMVSLTSYVTIPSVLIPQDFSASILSYVKWGQNISNIANCEDKMS